MGIAELIIIAWILVLASARVGKNIYIDAKAQLKDPTAEAPSLVERRARQELAQRQFETTGTPGVGQAIADRLAARVANPPPRPAWITEALAYLGLLFADAFAAMRRRHVEKERQRRGEQPRSGKRGGPYCWSCEFNHVSHKDDLCEDCTPVVLQRCPRCGHHVPVAELRKRDRCETCRRPPRQPGDVPQPGDDPGPIQLVVPMLSAAQPDPHRH
jgi:hypothetical protein